MAEHEHQAGADRGRSHTAGDQEHDHVHDAALAELLELDVEVAGGYLDELTGWIGQQLAHAPRVIVDLGAGTGAGSLALARRFPAAELRAIDRSDFMLQRLAAAAAERGLSGRLQLVQADLDAAWPAVDGVDLVWAASSLHEFAEPDRVLGDVRAALNPGGLLVVIERDSLPRFLPDDIALGRPGLEARCHAVLAAAHWNAHPDWRPRLERAGFEVTAQRRFPIEADPASSKTGALADGWFRNIRPAVEGHLAADDLATLDELLSPGSPHAVLGRTDLTVSGSRTAWAARRA